MQSETSSSRRLSVAVLAAVLTVAGLGYVALPAAGFGSSTPPPVPSVSAGGYMTCGVQADGTAACWGADVAPGDALAGTGMATPPGGTFLEVNSGYSHSCGVRTDGTLACWGSNVNGASTPPPGTFSHVAAGLNFSCALRTDGTAVCWGTDDAGQVSTTPTTETFTQLTVGIRHACGLRPDGTVVCWGSNTYGQLNVPAGTYTAVSSGNFDVCAIRPDGTVDCWGRNAFGQDAVPEGSFSQVSAGFGHVCGLRPDGTITCWGRNLEGQATPPAGTYTHVSTGTFHSCAMPTSGAPAVCWGNNAGGRVQPNLADTAPPSGAVGTPYAFQFVMTTHVAPPPDYSVVAGGLPPGLTLSEDGTLSGTPSQPGTYTFTVQATNGLSPPDCDRAPATGDFPCIPGDPGGPITATRTFTIVVLGQGSTTTTSSTSTTLPPTTTTSSTSTTTTSTPSPTTTTSTSAPTTTTSTPRPGGPIQIDDLVLSNGDVARVTGTITCPAGHRFRMGVFVTQDETEGRGIVTGTCTGEAQRFRVIVEVRRGPGFEDGPAQARAVAQVGDPDTRTVVDRLSTTEEVQIDVRDGMMAAMLQAAGDREDR